MQTDTLIIGAGLTGLTTAFWLRRYGIDTVVLERRDETGGQIKTHREQGFTFESGPNTGTISNPDVAELMAALEQTSDGRCRLETAPADSKRRLIWKGNRFHALPSGPVSAITTPLFTCTDKLRILGEPWRRRGTDPDESVGALARRRLGQSFVDYAVDPFLSGVYAGNPDLLVTRHALPKLYQLEQQYGSFIRGAIAKARQPKSERDRLATKQVFSAVGGLSRITDALADYVGSDRIVLGATDTRIEPQDDGSWQATYTDGGGQEHIVSARRVVTTCGAYELPALLPFVDAERMQRISSLRYAPVAEIAVGTTHDNGGDHRAFGGLVPSREQQQVLGILFPSTCFAGRAPQGGALFTYFVGGMRHPELVEKSDADLTRLALHYYHLMLGFPTGSQPELVRIFRHKHAIPQYEASSGERFAEVERLQRDCPGLIIAGNLRDGIGMAHRIQQAATIARSIAFPATHTPAARP